MPDPTPPSPDQIRQAAARIGALQPAYAPILDFYGEVFVAQEQSLATLGIAPVDMPESLARTKTREQFPLIAVSDFKVDVESAERLLAAICRLAQSAGGLLGPSAQALAAAVDGGRLPAESLFSAVLDREGFDMGDCAGIAGIPGAHAALLAYHAVRPSLVRCAMALSRHLEPDLWQRGCCPVCGSPPVLSVFGKEGARGLVCSFCWHAWRSPRIFCPFCESRDSRTRHHFQAEETPGCRVDLCGACRKYIKTADTRERSGIFYAPLEQVATLHLDIRAQEMGYASGSGLDLTAD